MYAKKRERRASRASGGDKEEGEGMGRYGCEGEASKRDERKRDGDRFGPTVRSERERDAPRRTASTRSRIGVAGAVPTSLLPHSGAPMAAWDTPISPTAMATSCDNGVRYSPSLKIYSNLEFSSSLALPVSFSLRHAVFSRPHPQCIFPARRCTNRLRENG